MNVLYISHYKEQTGWARAAIDNMLALESAGVNVIPRNVRLTSDKPTPEVSHLEGNLGKPDVVIQHVLPHHLEFCSAFKNIAYYVQDTAKTPSLWKRKLQMMDDVWCPNDWNAKLFNGKTVPHATDISKYKKEHNFLNSKTTDGTYIFYAIVDFNSRKNIEDLLRAYYIAFNKNTPVSLIIKASKFNTPPDETLEILNQLDKMVRTNLKLYSSLDGYKTPVFITDRMTDDEIMALHNTAHCYVDVSHGEAFSLPMFDAYAMNNTIVTSNFHSVNLPYLDGPGIFDYQYKMDSCYGYVDTFFELGNANDEWIYPQMNSLVEQMRLAYEYTHKGTRNVNAYSHQEIGKLMVSYL